MPRFARPPARPALFAALLSAGLLAGCGDSGEDPAPAVGPEEPPAAAGTDPAGPQAAGAQAAGPQAAEEPLSPYGTFRLLTPRQGQVSNFGSLTIAKGDGTPTLKSFVPTEQFKSLKPNVTLGEANAEGVSFTIKGEDNDEASLTFEGKPVPGGIVGTLHDETGNAVTPALLAPLPAGEPNPGPAAFNDPGFQQTVQAIGAVSQSVAGLTPVAKQRPYSPAFFALYPAAVASEAQQDKAPEEVKALAADYAAFAANWGGWAEADARRTSGAILLGLPKYREIADAELAAAVEALPESAPEGTAERWREQFDALRTEADRRADQQALSQRVEEAMKLAATDAEAGLAALRKVREERPEVPATLYRLAEGLYRFGGDAGREELRTLRDADPLDPVLVFLLAEAERRAGNAEEARTLFAEATAIPNGPYLIQPLLQRPELAKELKQPRERLNEELDDPQAVADLLAETYRRLAKGFATEDRPADESNRTVLVELFTGSQCPPCVAADVATTALAETFPAEDLLVLQYHLHIPGPDPLTNADTVARGAAVEVQGTPTLQIDGQQPEIAVGGPIGSAAQTYDALVEAVEERRSEPAGASVSIKTTAGGERFTAEVSAEREEPFTADHRLHVAVVEDEVTYAAPNGVRTHEMLVRSLPTGATGVRPNGEGGLSFRLESSVSDLRDELKAYLAGYEQDHDGRRFPEKPLQLTQLSVVAWVEDTTDGRVLQSSFAALGEFPPPPAEEEVETDAAPPAEPQPADPATAEMPADDATAAMPEQPAPAEGEPAPVAEADSMPENDEADAKPEATPAAATEPSGDGEGEMAPKAEPAGEPAQESDDELAPTADEEDDASEDDASGDEPSA